LVVAVVALMACGASTSVADVATATATAVPTATATPAPTSTPTPGPGVCKASDFPTKTPGGPSGFDYPPLTYSYDLTPGMGNHPYAMCSSGNPTSILTFMKNSVTTAGWKVTSTTAKTLEAENPTNPPSGFCYTVDVIVGGNASYPGEWTINFHPPAASCV
jgi:hypothetical protein